ncbi:MAG: hypothetical protein M3N54_08225, partial [Acidobacteriota bacterium]|nr:hypothetical protein [Acidobacteriota bacterium]
MSNPAGDAGTLVATDSPAPERRITIRGLPVFEGRLLSPDSPVFHSLRTMEDFRRFAVRLRGQFCLLIQDGSRFIAITDFGCSRPVFYLRDPETLQY